MPPGPVYNWYCVLSSAADIVSHAARYRASQLSRSSAVLGKRPGAASSSHDERNLDERVLVQNFASRDGREAKEEGDSSRERLEKAFSPKVDNARGESSTFRAGEDKSSHVSFASEVHTPKVLSTAPAESVLSEIPVVSPNVEPTLTPEPIVNEIIPADVLPEHEIHTRHLQSSKVPSSRIGRLFHYGGLAASLGYGAASELIRRSSSEDNKSTSLMLTEANIKRLVSKLSQMRGAALKLGQFLSIQDTHLLPPEVDKIFRRVQDSAHYMPDWQMEQVLRSSLGPSWEQSFESFDRIPFAAASIGQVHAAVLAASASPTGKPASVAVKVQFPNIADSIASDLGYVNMLLTAGRLLPKGLFLDRTIQVMKQELKDECDYTREASFLRKFGSSDYLGNDSRFKIPWVWEGSTDRVLVMERVDGVSIGENKISNLSQLERNEIASSILSLCLKELFEFRLMQTDPNYSNFLYDSHTRKLALVDFGATREYSSKFMDGWLRLLQSAIQDPEDREACARESKELGYLTGGESQEMLDAHIDSMILLAMPFKASTFQPVTFGPGSDFERHTNKIRELIPFMLQNRLTPPPKETYSLNRKLSGAFLMASRLRATVNTKEIWDSVVQKYRFEE